MPKLITVPIVSANANLPRLVTASTELAAFQSAMLANTGSGSISTDISSSDLQAITNFILDCKSALVEGQTVNLWDKLQICLPLAGLSLNAAKTPLKGNTPTVTSYVAGDYTRTGGLVGGTNKSFTIDNPPLSMPSDNLGMLIFTKGSNPSTTTHDVLAGSGSSTFGILINTDRVTSFGFTVTNGAGMIDNTTANQGTPGMHGWNRTATDLRYYKNGALVSTGALGGSRPAVAIPVFRNVNTYGGFLVTANCTSSEFTYISGKFGTLMAAFGR